jgi:hypothetical protein
MKMKKHLTKILLSVCVFTWYTNHLYAQGAYADVTLGYGTNMASSTSENGTFTNNLETSETVNFSLGKGVNFGGNFGYFLNNHIGFELGINYLLGGKNTSTFTGTDYKATYIMHAKMLRLIPSIILAAGHEKINPYAKFGFVIGTGSVFSEMEEKDDGDITIENWKYNGGMALGMNSAIGVLYTLKSNLFFFGEVNMINMSYAPTKGKITEATFNGKDELPDMTTRQKESEFVDSYSYDPMNPPPASEPRKELKYKSPFGSVGINIGLRFNL